MHDRILYDKGHGVPWPLCLYLRSRFLEILKKMELDVGETRPRLAVVGAVELFLSSVDDDGHVVGVCSPFVLDELTFMGLLIQQIAVKERLSFSHKDEIFVGYMRHLEDRHGQGVKVILIVEAPNASSAGLNRFQIDVPVLGISDQDLPPELFTDDG